MIVVSLFSIAVIGVDFGLFLFGSITVSQFAEYLLASVLAVVFLVAAERARVKRSMLQPNRQMLGAAISIITAGAFAGGVICFFGGGLLIGGLRQARNLKSFLSFTEWIFVSFTFGIIIGGFVGYLIYKRSRYSKMRYYNPFAD
jgi:hypothetical protein